MKTYARELTLFFTLLLACPPGHAAEQDNWYLDNEWEISNSTHYRVGVAYFENNVTGAKEIYACKGWGSSSRIGVYDLNGTLIRDITVASTRETAFDVAIDENGTIYIAEEKSIACLENDGTFKWRKGKNASISNYGSDGSGNGEFNAAMGIAVGPDGNLYVSDRDNHRCQVLDKNGNFIRKFGSNGSAPGQLRSPLDIIVFDDGTVLIGDQNFLNFFMTDGTFIKRVNSNNGKEWVSVSLDGTIVNYGKLKDRDGNFIAELPFGNSRSCFTPQGDVIESHYSSSKISLKVYKRAYRTKGLPVRNIIPQPAVRAITQRAGTNIIDLDFEIIDPDDANATVGILAAQDGAFTDTSKWILPQTWVDGTGSKIGTPIATNQVHRVSWNVKPDWPDSTGTLKFEIICRDARRTAPVDLHFLTLPLPDGNLTISRSPLKDSDFESYFKFLLAKGTTGIAFENGSIVKQGAATPAGSTQYVFTNAGKEGRLGPTWADVNASYAGTNLAGNVNMTSQGIQEWTVPTSGTYRIEIGGAQGGHFSSNSHLPGYGAVARGTFHLNAGEVLKILVGQMGQQNGHPYAGNAGGGGGTFVAYSNNTPIIIAGGGGGVAGASSGKGGTPDENGSSGVSGGNGGSGGNIGQTETNGGQPGGGFYGTSSKSFVGGGIGDNNSDDGGFGGGGGAGSNSGPGGGGGYSGGGGGGKINSPYTQFGGGGGGSYNSDANGTVIGNSNELHGFAAITYLGSNALDNNFTSTELLTSKLKFTDHGKSFLMNHLGFRYATIDEVAKAREADTAGGVNQWTAIRPIQPRNLPGKVNEYGFDTLQTPSETSRFWWVVQE